MLLKILDCLYRLSDILANSLVCKGNIYNFAHPKGMAR